MGSGSIEVADILIEHRAKMRFAKNDDVIETLVKLRPPFAPTPANAQGRLSPGLVELEGTDRLQRIGGFDLGLP